MQQRARVRKPPPHEVDVLLRDGSTVHLRPISPDDDEAMIALFNRLSPRSVYLRFHHVIREMTRDEVRRYTNVDYEDTYALVATLGEPPDARIIAVGRYSRLGNSDRAEVAFVVEDTYQGRGISSHLLQQLAIAAREHGIRIFEAEVLAENQLMMEVFRDSGFPLETTFEDGTFHVVFSIEETAQTEAKTELREQIAATASIRAFFYPSRVAVIGASHERGTIGAEIFHNILRDGFKGIVYPVNPNWPVVGSVRAYPTVLEVPDDVDMAVIAVPAEHVVEVAGQCARKGVRALVVISAGFKEIGGEGAVREDALLARVRSYGMRLVGPNCMGVLNTDPEVSLNATFSPVFPPRGNVGLLSQSGALGLALLDHARKLNLGLSTFISVGNKADVSANDLIQYWEQDESTDVILLYLESFGNPRKFGRIARRVSQTKPIVAVKSGRTAAGSRAASSHTGALAGLDVASEALFEQAGVIRTDTLEQLFDVATLLAHQPIPKGRRVAIITNAGGPGILAADACENLGLELPTLSPRTQAALRGFLPREAAVSNPVDLLASGTADDYGRALRLLFQDEGIDSLIVIYIPPLVTRPEAVANRICEAASEFWGRKPILTCFMSAAGAPRELSPEGKGFIPSFAFPEDAALALAKACGYAEWRAKPKGTVPRLSSIDSAAGRSIVDAALAKSDGSAWLSSTAAAGLLQAYGIPSARVAIARTAEEAAAAAKEIGFPVVVKIASSTILHKTDLGGVILDLRSEEEVRGAFEAIEERLRAAGRLSEMEGAVVQQMVSGGTEAIIGVTQDPSFGPLIMFGLGGIYVELLKDVAFRIHPLTDVDAREMVESVKGFPLLRGWRGAEPADIAALEDVLLRVSAMVEDVPEIGEMDLNPVKVLAAGRGCTVVDSRILLKQVEPGPWSA
ncbi:MAG: GNAT family N-acetyltransferase [Dehalococcoidia bacterium]|nr:GNAT family N-acetyltransferase [Dehalococcoidia bacterium]